MSQNFKTIEAKLKKVERFEARIKNFIKVSFLSKILNACISKLHFRNQWT